MNMLHIQASDFHQLPSLILIPRAPRWVRWMLDEAVIYWRSARDAAEKTETADSSTFSNAAERPTDALDGGLSRWNGRAVPWVERGPDGKVRRVART
jgi:hypothetical protein